MVGRRMAMLDFLISVVESCYSGRGCLTFLSALQGRNNMFHSDLHANPSICESVFLSRYNTTCSVEVNEWRDFNASRYTNGKQRLRIV